MSKSKSAKIGMPWRFEDLFNEAIRCLPEHPLVKREHMWASELGGDYCTRYLRMHAHPMSNPPNERSRRKFISGHIFEWIVELILTLTGVIKEKQMRGEVQLPGKLRVSGKLDFIAGGVVDWEKAKAEVKMFQKMFASSHGDMPPVVFHSVERILWRMEQMFSRVPLLEMIMEVKSVSGFVGDLIEKTQKPRHPHPLQILHYEIANKEKHGALVYVNKDSFMCYQFEITPTKQMLKLYHDDVSAMTEIYNASGKNYIKNIPPKSPEVHYVEDEFRFSKNMHVEYSPYLTMLYGYPSFEEFKKKWEYELRSWNYTFKRCVKGERVTEKNFEVIHKVSKLFPWDEYVEKARKAGAFQSGDQEEEE